MRPRHLKRTSLSGRASNKLGVQLDSVDVAILRALQADSRSSFRDIAKKVGVSVPTVSARVQRLEGIGVVRGYHANVSVDKLGESTVIAIVKSAPSAVDDVGKSLSGMDNVRRLYALRGSKLMVEAVVGSSGSVDKFLESISKIPGVMDYEQYLSVSRIKDEPSAVIEDTMSATLQCFECHKLMDGDPIKKKLDGKDHYFCCRSCEKLYLEKYRKIKSGL